MEAGDIADSGRTSHELCDKRCLRLAVDFDRRSRLFDMSMVGYDDLICNLNCLILIVRDKNAGDADSRNHLPKPASKFLTYFCVNGCISMQSM